MIAFWVVYLAGVIPAWVLVARGLHKHHRRQWPSLSWGRGDDLFAFFWGFAISLIAWPLLAVGWALSFAAPRVMDRMIGVDRWS